MRPRRFSKTSGPMNAADSSETVVVVEVSKRAFLLLLRLALLLGAARRPASHLTAGASFPVERKGHVGRLELSPPASGTQIMATNNTADTLDPGATTAPICLFHL